MRNTNPKLRRVSPGLYTSNVRPRGVSCEPFEITVEGPSPGYKRETSFGYRWMVTGDDERFFDTLAQARTYLARFFEAA